MNQAEQPLRAALMVGATSTRQAWRAPELVRFGAVANLTASGSGATREINRPWGWVCYFYPDAGNCKSYRP